MSKLRSKEESLVINAVQGELTSSFGTEGLKGQDSTICKTPVDLEPHFDSYLLEDFKKPRRIFLCLWPSPKNECFFKDFEMFFKEISIIKTPIEFLLAGNSKNIVCQIGINPDSSAAVIQALRSRFPLMEIDKNTEHCFTQLFKNCKISTDYLADLRDFYPDAHYWKSLSGYENAKSSPLMPLCSSLSQLKEDEFGWYQVTFKSTKTSSKWRENIVNLCEAQHESGKYSSLRQNTSAFGQDYIKEAKDKINAHSFFAVSIRLGLFSKAPQKGILNSLSLSMAALRYGRNEMRCLTKADYKAVLSDKQIAEMIVDARIYRQGMILNSTELNALAHISSDILARNDFPINKAVGFKAQNTEEDGVVLGYNEYAGKRTLVIQPERIRNLHTLISGLISGGKSVLEHNMALSDARRGLPFALIGPHGQVPKILSKIPKEQVENTIYFNPSDNRYIFQYNPFQLNPGEDIVERTDTLVACVRDLYPRNEWGASIQTILYATFYTLLRGKNLCFTDAVVLLAKTNEGDQLRQEVLPQINDPFIKKFWLDSFERMSKASIDRAAGKLQQFFLRDKVRRIFEQRTNKLNFKQIIDEGKNFAADVNSGILGEDTSKTLGRFLISQFYHAGMQRLKDIGTTYLSPYTLYIDELANFKVRSIEQALVHLRKTNVRLVLAFQQYDGLSESVRLALGNCGTMLCLNQDWTGAQRVFRDFQGKVPPENFMGRNVGEAYLKMPSGITTLTTFPEEKTEGSGYTNEIIELTRRNYCVPIKEVKETTELTNQEEAFDEI